jgi:hypothetical protein
MFQVSERKICPRCGNPFSYIEEVDRGGRLYLYAVHYVKDESGKRKKKRCYLGPKDGYEYVSKTHDIIFYGLDREDRYIKYLEEILDLFASEGSVSTDFERFKRDYENTMKMRSLIKKIGDEIDDRLRRILETMISDVKASIDVLKRDYPDNPKAQEIVKELSDFDREIERTGLDKSFIFLKDEAIRSFVEKYLELKQRLKQFGL